MGFGGRVGAFMSPRFSVEFEAGAGSADRPNGLESVNVGVLSGRLLFVPLRLANNRISILLGGGVDHTDANFFESYGYHGLLGLKVGLSESVALRLDGIRSWMATGDGANTSFHFGLSVYRQPAAKMTSASTVVYVPGPEHHDSVSAVETARLRAIAANYQALRDSLGRPIYPDYLAPTSAAALATMERMVLFTRNSTELSP